MFKYVLGIVVATLASCGGGGGSGSNNNGKGNDSDPQVENCVVLMNTITLASGEACNFAQEDADLYSLTAGDLSCDDGTLTYDGNQFFSASGGIILNGFGFVCSDT